MSSWHPLHDDRLIESWIARGRDPCLASCLATCLATPHVVLGFLDIFHDGSVTRGYGAYSYSLMDVSPLYTHKRRRLEKVDTVLCVQRVDPQWL
ncbi:hypothetical protein HETIRDRAFT_173565 [Heterobasidion irregulare TC 32-1]|uniref:Uncharacterized protein n=1 Tax=Heterobasidion irregulare (strain TC 32-1) TaxID=747525 RepID=W4K953_HETIT|nr:uncharacterized protein HETIRDRAFT_173565 [Heterobasidion irregulare TC 32-1]ETW81880.1 hypothetical protein HETIRDRAFT_173565 [Heterobasidion irregulare TC 32-1]